MNIYLYKTGISGYEDYKGIIEIDNEIKIGSWNYDKKQKKYICIINYQNKNKRIYSNNLNNMKDQIIKLWNKK